MTTTGDEEFIIHTPAEKDLIPIVLHHYPICVTYALFNEGKTPVADPSALEERVSDASLVLAVNSYKELCCMHLAGVALTSPSLILRCSELAAERSWKIVQFIKSTLEEDEYERKKGNLPKGFAETITLTSVPSNYHDEGVVKYDHLKTFEMEDDSHEQSENEGDIELLDSKTVTTGQCEKNTSEEGSSDDEDMEEPTVLQAKRKKPLITGDSSEEEQTVVLK